MYFVKHMYPDIFWYKNTTDNVVSLTIDDAPTENTNEILDILDKYNCKATFFIIESYAKKYPEIMERIKNSGHEMGNHMCKDRPSFKLPIDKYRAKLLKCDELLTNVGAFDDINDDNIHIFNKNDIDNIDNDNNNKNYKWTRPGSGFFNKEMIKVAKEHNYSLCLGNVYPFDPHIKFPMLNGRHVVFRTSPGSIIIIHDRPYTMTTLTHILESLSNKYTFLTLTQLANHTNPK